MPRDRDDIGRTAGSYVGGAFISLLAVAAILIAAGLVNRLVLAVWPAACPW